LVVRHLKVVQNKIKLVVWGTGRIVVCVVIFLVVVVMVQERAVVLVVLVAEDIKELG
jgi:hypothetical protein